MHRRAVLAASLLAIARPVGAAETLILRASDGGAVYGECVHADGPRHGTILLFHMAGSNRGEYAPIAPELARLGWDSIAIDQRSGGPLWGRVNETVAHRGGSTGFADVMLDLEAALAAVPSVSAGGRIMLWGSSYSAALVFLLAASHPQNVAGVLAFSPGEFIPGHNIRAASAKLTCPIFVTSADDPGEVAAAREIIGASPARLRRQFVPHHGTHGSSTIRQDSNPAGAAETWQAVRDFLDAARAI